jgi:hypothetical protein
MLLDAVLDQFVEQCPAVVIVRATLENLLCARAQTPVWECTRCPALLGNEWLADQFAMSANRLN